MSLPLPFAVVAGVAGITVECRTDDPETARCFAEIIPPTAPLSGSPRHIYDIRRAANGYLLVTTDTLDLGRTPHPGNAVAAIEFDVKRAAETYHPESIWLHAAALAREDGSALLCIGASGAGKSTASLALLGAGWRYLADDAVLLDPVDRGLVGLGWPLRLADIPETLAVAGFVIASDKRIASGEGMTLKYRLTPPPALVWNGTRPARLDRCLFLERGPLALEPLSPGQALLRLWPRRILRSDGREPWEPGALAARLAGVQFAVLRTERIDQLVPAVAGWIGEQRGSSR